MTLVESFAVRCNACDQPVAAQSAGSYEVREEPELQESTEFLLLKCQHCSSPFLAKRNGFYVGGDIGWAYDRIVILHPTERVLDASIPRPIARSYAEAASCSQSQCFTACAIMCRRTLEGICAHRDILKGNLESKLKKLKDDGVIEQRLFEWADSLRLVGNEAAHDVYAEVSKEDARDLLDFTRALVEYIFTFTEAFARFNERRAKPKPTS
jgi:hypothetical protein